MVFNCGKRVKVSSFNVICERSQFARMYLRMRVGVDGLGPPPLPVQVAQVQRPPGHGVRRAGHRHDAHVAVQADLGGRLAEEWKQAPDEGVVADEVDSHLQLEAVLGPPRLCRVRGEEAATFNGRRKNEMIRNNHN